MFGPLGVPEVLFILVVALLVFGPKRLPKMGRTLGRAMGEFRRASSDLRRTLNAEIALEEDDDERPKASRRPPSASVSRTTSSPASSATPEADPTSGGVSKSE